MHNSIVSMFKNIIDYVLQNWLFNLSTRFNKKFLNMVVNYQMEPPFYLTSMYIDAKFQNISITKKLD